MSRVDDVKEFANMTKQVFKDFVETFDKEIKNFAFESDNSTFTTGKENANKAKISDEYYRLKEEIDLDKSSKLKEETDLEERTSSIRKKDLRNEQISLDLDFREENIMQALVYAEIFGKPKAKRRRR